jgi:hypothetical protein
MYYTHRKSTNIVMKISNFQSVVEKIRLRILQNCNVTIISNGIVFVTVSACKRAIDFVATGVRHDLYVSQQNIASLARLTTEAHVRWVAKYGITKTMNRTAVFVVVFPASSRGHVKCHSVILGVSVLTGRAYALGIGGM